MKPAIVVVGLGPAGPELITAQTRLLLDGDDPLWLRTRVHPAADGIDAAGSFDHVYESADTFEEVYSTIVEQLVAEASAHGRIVYAVPGSPVVAEHTVELLRSDERIELDVLPAMSFLELSWTALGVDPMTAAVTIVDALQLVEHAASRRGPLLITQVHSRSVLDDVILALDDLGPDSVTVLQGLGTGDQQVTEIPWAELRGTCVPDHLTTLWVPSIAEPIGAAFAKFESLVQTKLHTSLWMLALLHSTATRKNGKNYALIRSERHKLQPKLSVGSHRFCPCGELPRRRQSWVGKTLQPVTRLCSGTTPATGTKIGSTQLIP